MEELKCFYEDKVILVTGGVGSIGSEIIRKILEYNPKAVRVLDSNETGLFDLEQELQSEKIRLFVGDVKDKERLKKAMEDVDIVFHAAALKHVPLCEYNPFEAVKTNVIGTQNLIDVVMDEEVEKFITISTDKAVNPINVMGATKLLAERLTISANFYKGKRATIFSCVRFGNVLNSRGSVIPLFKRQICSGGPITITHQEMTRFIMSIPSAIELVLKSAEMAQGGEIFILKMKKMKIIDLAEVLIDELAPKYGYNAKEIEITFVGDRGVEKISEELITKDEAANVYEDEKMYIIYPQKCKHDKLSKSIDLDYLHNCTKQLNKSELKNLLLQNNLL
jgi:FlaA1/EpsC-like NDP-sugar epimerase